MLVYPSGTDASSSALRFLSATAAGPPPASRHPLATSEPRPPGPAGADPSAVRASPTLSSRPGFGVDTTTAAYRYIAETVDVLTALTPDPAAAVKMATRKAFVILDGTLLPIDRVPGDRLPKRSPRTSNGGCTKRRQRSVSP